MAEALRTFDTFFPKNIDYDKDSQNLLELVTEMTHDNKSGYLFKHLKTNAPLFVRKDQLLEDTIDKNSQYHFLGFVDNSSVVVIAKRV